MEERLTELENKQQQLVDAIMELNGNLASMGYSTTESIKAIMEGFQSINSAIHSMVENFAQLERRIEELEKPNINLN